MSYKSEEKKKENMGKKTQHPKTFLDEDSQLLT